MFLRALSPPAWNRGGDSRRYDRVCWFLPRTLKLQFILLVLAIVIMHKNEDGLPLTKGLTKPVFHNFNCF